MYGILIAGAIFVLVGAIALLLYVTMQRPSVEQKTNYNDCINYRGSSDGDYVELFSCINNWAFY